MDIEREADSIQLSDIGGIDLAKSCCCGQAFRWRTFTSSDGTVGQLGVVRGCAAFVSQANDNSSIRITSKNTDRAMWRDYFDLERDYASIEELMMQDCRLSVCFPAASGIRVFNQEPFEALISFIISQNNNIKRIAGIIERLCALCGKPMRFMGETLYSFPSPTAIAELSPEMLAAIGCGYRAPFIKAAAERVALGYDLERLRRLPLSDARAELLTFYGIGPKVADCVLLFSLGHTDAFPVDVWIDRAMRALFFEGGDMSRKALAEAVNALGMYSGVIQQYIFQYAREAGRRRL